VAQVWNQSFYRLCIAPGGSIPPENLVEKKRLWQRQAFVDDFKSAAPPQFGSGWAWLVLDGNDLKIIKTAIEDTPCCFSFQTIAHCQYVRTRLIS
jgi:Fe-Mn family superoxide dismutase